MEYKAVAQEKKLNLINKLNMKTQEHEHSQHSYWKNCDFILRVLYVMFYNRTKFPHCMLQ